MTESNENRVTCKRPHPNPHIHDILYTLYNESQRIKCGYKPVLIQAIDSLSRYPLPLSSGSECAILKGFNWQICEYIDSKLNIKENVEKKQREPGNKVYLRKDLHSLLQLGHSQFVLTSSHNSVGNITKLNNRYNIAESPPKKKLKPRRRLVPSHQLELGIQFVERDFSDNYDNEAYIQREGKSILLQTCMQDKNVKQSKCGSNHNITANFGEFSRCNLHNLNEADYQYEYVYSDLTASPSTSTHQIDLESCTTHNSVSRSVSSESSSSNTHVSYNNMDNNLESKSLREIEDGEKVVVPRKMYRPKNRSGAYAILIALLEQQTNIEFRDRLTKEELIQKAQKHSDESFTNSKPESNCTAWANAKRLVNRGLLKIMRCDNTDCDFYMLTSMGIAVATELLKSTKTVTMNDIIFRGQHNDRVPSLGDMVISPLPHTVQVEEESNSDPVFIEMPPGSFDIILLIDKRESKNATKTKEPAFTMFEKYVADIKYEHRCLTVGDFAWVARSKRTGQELTLPYIVERKRMDDLGASIKDGRFHEQKFRLRKCGLETIMYLVESYANNKNVGLPMSTLMQAVANTSIQDGFMIVKTESLVHTTRFLAIFTQKLMQDLLTSYIRGSNSDTQGRELTTFEFFNKACSKNKPLTVKETFIKMLLQLKGLSVEKALAITEKYSTPRLLMNAYDRCTAQEGELLLASLKYNEFTAAVGPAVSKAIYQLFNKDK